ncbi:MAG TPA: DUF6152 family protein [Steroidobacteraceae bacterium]|nr:DUF6152 family protein [Steroidobacteraceae bacterium]
MRSRTALGLILISGVWTGATWAHHSFAMFDQAQTKTLVGTVKQVQWTNPHIWVQVLVPDQKGGSPQEWSIEGGSPNALSRQGWRRSSIKEGDAIEITIHPLKDGTNGGSMMKAMVNGQAVGGPRG